MKNEFENKSNKKIKPLIIATLLNAMTTVLSIFIFSIAIYFLGKGYNYASLFATISLAFGSFVSAFYLANFYKKRGFFIGLINGSIIFSIVVIISLIVDDGGITFNTLFHFIIILLASLIGGIMGVNKSSEKKYI